MKFRILTLVVMCTMVLSSCRAIVQEEHPTDAISASENSTSSAATSAETSEVISERIQQNDLTPESSATTQVEISASDIVEQDEPTVSEPTPRLSTSKIQDISLKQYSDYDGKNKFDDYTINGYLKTPSYQSRSIPFDYYTIGSQYLSWLQALSAKAEEIAQPSEGFCTVITVVDDGVAYIYYFHENGMMFTEQGDQLYYLGKDDFTVHMHTMIYAAAAVEMAEKLGLGQPQLPVFVESNQNRSDVKSHDEAMTLRQVYSADEYDVAIVAFYQTADYPLKIYNNASKEIIINAINTSSELVENDEWLGSCKIVRLYNDNGCHDFMVYDDLIKNCQIQNDSYFFVSPNYLTRSIDFIVAKEIAYLLV